MLSVACLKLKQPRTTGTIAFREFLNLRGFRDITPETSRMAL
jgi:hypothetical protein